MPEIAPHDREVLHPELNQDPTLLSPGAMPGLPATAEEQDPLAAQARVFLKASKAASTLRAYQSDWEHFRAWCEERGATPLPATPETVALYLVALAATHRPATITRRLTSISKAHAVAKLPSPASLQHAVVAETPARHPPYPRRRAAGQAAAAHGRPGQGPGPC